RGKDDEPFSRLNQRGGNSSPWTQNLCGFPPAPGVGVVFDRQINPLIFSYQTDFQLSSSSGNGLVEQKFASGQQQWGDTDYISQEEKQKVELMLEFLTEESKQAAASIAPTSEEDLCPICYAHSISAVFRPCSHKSC
ncbi:hypothetical protein AMECASPLE_020168, partial [Ameca splendens]